MGVEEENFDIERPSERSFTSSGSASNEDSSFPAIGGDSIALSHSLNIVLADHNREGNSLAASGAAPSPSKTDLMNYEGIPLEDYFSLVKISLDKSLDLLPSPHDGTSISNAGAERESFGGSFDTVIVVAQYAKLAILVR
ncbi:hypothetical protein L484_005548 [Morus notabilis]|uniref:Uncharacterized protein n=1 Tax=Morus notabilis TaxID=981085 RepID=W9R0Q6_9ROSA|nr:hypothetical protein L484_005548 [Morus notabilis]